jgi:hypothetical protein
VGFTIGLHSNQSRWRLDEELGHLVTLQVLLESRLTLVVDSVKPRVKSWKRFVACHHRPENPDAQILMHKNGRV